MEKGGDVYPTIQSFGKPDTEAGWNRFDIADGFKIQKVAVSTNAENNRIVAMQLTTQDQTLKIFG
jgi:hypothetical protein